MPRLPNHSTRVISDFVAGFVVGYRCGTAPDSNRTFPVDGTILSAEVARCKAGMQALLMTAAEHGLADELRRVASGQGFELVGFLDAAAYDAALPELQQRRRVAERVPGVATVVLLGSGGRGFWDMLQAGAGIEGRARPDYHPIDVASRQRLEVLVELLRGHAVPASLTMPDDDDALDFLRLATMAGLGVISPVIGLLLHPVYGPWVSLRGALLVEGRPFGAVASSPLQFDPCADCDAIA